MSEHSWDSVGEQAQQLLNTPFSTATRLIDWLVVGSLPNACLILTIGG